MGNERLPETLLERVLDERKMPIEKSLWAIAYIYNEYVLEKRRQTESTKNN
jgi:hypothetical protein